MRRRQLDEPLSVGGTTGTGTRSAPETGPSGRNLITDAGHYGDGRRVGTSTPRLEDRIVGSDQLDGSGLRSQPRRAGLAESREADDDDEEENRRDDQDEHRRLTAIAAGRRAGRGRTGRVMTPTSGLRRASTGERAHRAPRGGRER